MTIFGAEENAHPDPSACWCCGRIDTRESMVHLGNHPEVALCLGCARWAAQQASEIEDHGRTGPLVRARGWFRSLRREVVDRGWHTHRVFGAPLRWIGKRLP